MPYQWTKSETEILLRLEPHRSMQPKEFAWFIVPTAVLFLMPLMAVLGSPILWVLLVFLGGALWAVWAAIMTKHRAMMVVETLSITKDTVRLEHAPRKGTPQIWQANPYWVQVHCDPDGGPVKEYVTLQGGPRTVEIGRFLSAPERADLALELRKALRDAEHLG